MTLRGLHDQLYSRDLGRGYRKRRADGRPGPLARSACGLTGGAMVTVGVFSGAVPLIPLGAFLFGLPRVLDPGESVSQMIEREREGGTHTLTIEDKLRADYMAGSQDSMDADTIAFVLAVDACDDLDAPAPAQPYRPNMDLPAHEREKLQREAVKQRSTCTCGDYMVDPTVTHTDVPYVCPACSSGTDAPGGYALTPDDYPNAALQDKRQALERALFKAEAAKVAYADAEACLRVERIKESLVAISAMVNERKGFNANAGKIMVLPGDYFAGRALETPEEVALEQAQHDARIADLRMPLELDGALAHDYETSRHL
jgi:hypothetical protein